MLCFDHQKTTSSFCVYFHSRFVCGILLEFVFTICSFNKLFSVSELFCLYIRDLKRKCYVVFFGSWKHYFSVNALHIPWCTLPIILRFISPLFCGVIFVFLVTFNSKFFFSVFRYRALLGGLETSYLEQALPKQRVRVLYPVQWNSFWVDSLIIFPEFGVHHFEHFHRIWNFLTFFAIYVVVVFFH